MRVTAGFDLLEGRVTESYARQLDEGWRVFSEFLQQRRVNEHGLKKHKSHIDNLLVSSLNGFEV